MSEPISMLLEGVADLFQELALGSLYAAEQEPKDSRNGEASFAQTRKILRDQYF